MTFDLWNNTLDFNISSESHHIEMHQNSATAVIDGVQLYNVNYVTNFNFHLPSFDSGTEVITIYGHNKEGENFVYNLFVDYANIENMNIDSATMSISNFIS